MCNIYACVGLERNQNVEKVCMSAQRDALHAMLL